MQSKAVFVLSTACLFASAAVADAQIIYNTTTIPSRFSIGGDFAISQPKSEFAANVPTGYGFDFTGLFKLDRKGWFSLRGDIGGVQYGHEHIGLGFVGTGRVEYNVNTNNRLGFGTLGLQVQFPDGWLRPYANASYGVMDFFTDSCLSATDDSIQEQCTKNHDDWTSAGVVGGGVLIPFGKSLGALNLGARYHYGGTATYLKKGDIVDNPDGSVTLNLRNSKTDFVLWQVGISFTLPQSTGQ